MGEKVVGRRQHGNKAIRQELGVEVRTEAKARGGGGADV